MESLSLNLEQRKTERAALEAERLARENTRRVARGLPALESLEKLEKLDASEDAPDPVLDEAAHIVADLGRMAGAGQPRLTSLKPN